MQKSGKILVVTQHYPPDPTTTAVYIGAIAEALALDSRVLVFSGSPRSGSQRQANPAVVEIPAWTAPKNAPLRRAVAISLFGLRIHFLLSGWGIGWSELNALQAAERLDNVSLLPPVPQADLAELLSSADVWIIPYRRNIRGVSISSRLHNLLGRAFIVAADPESGAALVVEEEQICWVVRAEDSQQLADAICEAAADRAGAQQTGRRAAAAADKYDQGAALARYRQLILDAANSHRRSE